MVPRIYGNMRPVLLKLEKLPLRQSPNAGKTTISSSNNGSTEDANCKRCEKLIAKAFNTDDKESTVYATTANRDEEKLTQKLETIEEQPLVEAESKVEGFNVSPKILGNNHHTSHPIDHNLRKIYGADKKTTLDDIAVKLMKFPSNEIDRKLKEKFETYGNFLMQENVKTDEIYDMDSNNKKTEEAIVRLVMRCNERPVISYNIETVEKKQSEMLVDKSIDKTEGFFKNNEFISERKDKHLSEQSPPFYREYEIHLQETPTENTCRAEKPQPMHIDVEFLKFIEKSSSRERILKKLEEPGSGQFITSCEVTMIPLPSNETAISSQASKIPTCSKSEVEQDDIKEKPMLLNTAISFKTLPKSIERRDSISEKYYQSQQMGTFNSGALSDSKSPLLDQTHCRDHNECISTTIADLASVSNSSKDKQNKSANAGSMNKSENVVDEENLSLSELLRRIRQRNKRKQEKQSELKTLRCSEKEALLSKSTNLPPLDLRPRSKQCPPRPCPARQSPCQPPPICPPPKNPCPTPCPPPTKPICPPPKNPCPTPCPPPTKPCDPCPPPCPPPQDPCKPPPVCPPPKSPCPCKSPKSNPCGFYIGNKFKDTITLILCYFAPTNIFRNAFGLSTLNWNLPHNVGNSSRDLTKASDTEDVYLRLRKLGNQDFNFQYKNIAAETETKYEQEERREEVIYARSFEPWTPIPSWPMPKKEIKMRFVCPKEGCKLPTSHSTHSKGQYKETPNTKSRCPKCSLIDTYFIP